MLKPFCWPGVGGAEPAAHARAHEGDAGGDLAVGRGPEILEAFDSQRAAQGPVAVHVGDFDVAVRRDVAAGPGARGQRAVAEEPVRAGREPLSPTVRADRP